MTNDITNYDRAAWAAKALAAFTGENGSDHPGLLSPIDLQSAITDLMADLLHFAHIQGFDAARIAVRASTHFEYELREEARHP